MLSGGAQDSEGGRL